MADPELVQTFYSAMSFLEPRSEQYSVEAAVQHFSWCLHLDNSTCDAWRGLGVAENGGQGPVTLDQIVGAWRNLETYGETLTAVGLPEYMLAGTFETGMWGTKRKWCTRADLTHAYVTTLIEGRDYDEAKRILDSIPGYIPFTELLKGYLFYVTRRWSDVVAACGSLENAPTYQTHVDEPATQANGSDPQMTVDPLVHGLSALMVGEALVYLEQYDAGIDRLKSSLVSSNTKVSARAAFLTGMAYRARGDEKRAQEFLAQAQARGNDPSVFSAKNTPTYRLPTTSAEMIDARTSYWDYSTEPNLDDHRATEAEERRSDLLAEAERKMDSLIGLQAVRNQIERLRYSVEGSLNRKRLGLPVKATSQHIAFTGPPGTGKTTVASVVGDIYAGLGLIQRPGVKVVTRADLVDDKVGGTAKMTQAVIEEADGGVLFIDEAYALAPKAENQTDFGQECIDTLVAQMDLRRETLVVIIAGYPGDIDRLLDANDGLRSRFSRKIEFESYTPEEIRQIAEVTASGMGFRLSEGASEYFEEVSSGVLMTRDKRGDKRLIDQVGNGRFVRNAVEQAIEEKDVRLGRAAAEQGAGFEMYTPDEVTILETEDVKGAIDRILAEYLKARPAPEDGFVPEVVSNY